MVCLGHERLRTEQVASMLDHGATDASLTPRCINDEVSNDSPPLTDLLDADTACKVTVNLVAKQDPITAIPGADAIKMFLSASPGEYRQ